MEIIRIDPCVCSFIEISAAYGIRELLTPPPSPIVWSNFSNSSENTLNDNSAKREKGLYRKRL